MVVLRSIIFVKIPPIVSIPRDKGVTSRSNTSLTSPTRTPAWIAAPIATHSSGLMPLSGSFPRIFLIASWTAGIRLEPPTRIILSISSMERPESLIAWRVGSIVACTRSDVNSLNLARVSVRSKCFGPLASAVMNGKLMFVDITVDNSIFAFSAASFKRCSAILSCERSMPVCFLNSSTNQFITALSKSSPPKWVLPFVALTSKTPSPNSRIDTSNVPPPKSNTRILPSPPLSRPYARAAAVGSLIIRNTSRPAILPASFVAWRWLSEK